LERVAAVVSTAPATVNGRCQNAQTQEGVSVDLEFSVTYELFPDEAEIGLKPKVARFLPSGAAGLVRNHASNCVAQVVNRKSVETLCQKGARSRVERDLRDAVQDRLHPFGISVHRVMVTGVLLPRSVQKALEEAHEHRVYAESEACGLERLHLALNQFSDVDVERLLQLRQLRELGQNGVALYMPYLGNMGNRGNTGESLAGNGRSPQDNPSFSADRPGGRVNGKAYG
jgi:regulator of protease activity HflC (stomatin/prohibitin superfamily)